MALVESQDSLGENAPNKILSYVLATLTFSTLLDQLRQIAALTELHDQIDWSVLFVNKLVIASHDVVCLYFAEDLDFIVELLTYLVFF